MKVIFLQNCEHGKAGEIKTVSDGLAKNVLIKKGFALEGTEQNLKLFAKKKEKVAIEKAEAKAVSEKLFEDLNGRVFDLSLAFGEKLHGSVGIEKVIELVLKESGIDLTGRIFAYPKINTAGKHSIIVNVGSSLKAEIFLNLIRIY